MSVSGQLALSSSPPVRRFYRGDNYSDARLTQGGIETAQLLEDLIGDLTAVPQPIEVKIFGHDATVLQSLALRIAQETGRIAGVVEVRSGVAIAGDSPELEIDRVKAGFEGLDSQAVTA